MAESIVFFVVAKLGDLIAQEFCFLHKVGDQLRSLRDEFQWMQAFLKDADGSIRGGNERAKLWVNQVRDVAYDAEDIIDTYIYKIHQRRRRPSSRSLTNCITSASQLTILHELGDQIANVKKRAEEISANRSKYGIESVGGTSSDIISIITTSTMSFNRKQNQLDVEEADVVGFDKHVKTLVKLLITAENQGSHDQRRAVISIVGMGGLGKSTLAKKVCSNHDVKRHFTCQALVYVSHVFKTQEILERIAKCAMAMSEEKMKALNQEKLKDEICDYLKGKRYLVVLDDVWTRDAWDRIKDVLPEVKNGSRVLLTTRNADVGVHADRRSPLFKLQNLGEDESWDLFCKKAIHSTNSMNNCPSHLEYIGKEMVAKCGGLPLAIVVLGGLVSRKEQTIEEWRKVLKSLKWQLQEGEDQISPILDLSYHHLPYYLKPCFLYFAVFPEDAIIDPKFITRLWIAEGFIQARGAETLEEVAEDYLQELVHRSMIQVAPEANLFGNVYYQIHDLILDLSISQAKVDNFLHVPKNSEEVNILHKTRRLALIGNEMSSYIVAGKYSANSSLSLRTITCMDMEVRTSKKVGFLHEIKLLRVLNLDKTRIKKLPSDIGKLIHLRYLGLEGTRIKTLPSSIAELTNLQTLGMSSTRISTLPRGIWKMGNNLRHLEGYKISIKGTPSIESLPNLQTLSDVRVGQWLLNGLRKMTSLRKLGLRNVTDTYAEPLLDCLGKLDNLNYLNWEAADGSIVPSSLLSTSQSHHRRHLQLQEVWLNGRIERLPESNRMNAYITILVLLLSKLEEDPLVTLGELGNLQFLYLFYNAFVGEEMVCLERGFPQLKHFVLDGLNSLKRWNIEDQAMPKLKYLSLDDCQKLVMLPDGLERITSLQELTVGRMPDSFNKRLRADEGEDWGKIRHIPSVTMW